MNKRGQLVAERLGWANEVMGAEREFSEWVEDGRGIITDLRAAAHGELDPRSVNEARVRNWQKYGWNMEATAKAFGQPVVNDWVAANPEGATAVARSI